MPLEPKSICESADPYRYIKDTLNDLTYANELGTINSFRTAEHWHAKYFNGLSLIAVPTKQPEVFNRRITFQSLRNLMILLGRMPRSANLTLTASSFVALTLK